MAFASVAPGRRAALYLARSELPGANGVAVLRAGLDEDAGHAPMYWALARMFQTRGEVSRGRAVFEEGVGKVGSAGRAQVLRSWAVWEYEVGEKGRSLVVWRRAVEEGPRDVKAWRRLAEAEENVGDGAEVGLKVLMRGLEVHPRSGVLRVCAARLCERVEGAGGARELLEHFGVEDDADVQRALGMLEVREGNFERARLVFRKAADLEKRFRRDRRRKGRRDWRDESTTKSLHAWALMEVKVGQIDAARELLVEAQGDSPEDPAIWRALAEIEARERNFEAARQAYKRSVAIEDGDVRLWLAWGKTEAVAGNLADAEKLLLTAIDRFEEARTAPQGGQAHVAGGARDKSSRRIGRGSDALPAPSMPPAQSRTLAEALKELSAVAVQRGDIDKAISLLERATGTDPTYDLAWRTLSQHVLRKRGIESVREMYGQALDACQSNIHGRLYHWWALDERQDGQIREARFLFEKATEIEPAYMSAWLSWGLLEKSVGAADRACELFEEAASLATRSSIRSPFIFHAWGRVEELNRGDPGKARCVFMRGCQLTPDCAMLLHARAQLEERCGELGEARRLLKKASGVEPGNGFIWQTWGMLEARRRNYERAVEIFETGAAEDQKNGALLSSWAMMEGRDLQNLSRGRELFTLAASVEPQYAGTWHAWGSLEVIHHEYDRARTLYLKSAELAPDDPKSWHALGMLEGEHSPSFSKPVEYFQKAIEADPTHAISYQAWALFVERKELDIAGARKLYEKGVESCDQDGKAILYQSWALAEQRSGDISKARSLLVAGLEVHRGCAELWATYALLEKALGNRKAARRLFKDGCANALPLGGNHQKFGCLYAAWGAMEAEMGNTDEARSLFERGLRFNPSHAPLWHAFAAMEAELGNKDRAAELRSSAKGRFDSGEGDQVEVGEERARDDGFLESLNATAFSF